MLSVVPFKSKAPELSEKVEKGLAVIEPPFVFYNLYLVHILHIEDTPNEIMN
jgi:hypothetical protein